MLDALLATVLAALPGAVEPVDRLTLRQQVGQTIIFTFNGTTAPAYARRILRDQRAAGVILFGSNTRTETQTRALARELQRAGGGRVLIAADQEGGATRTLPFLPPELNQSARTGEAQARVEARATARGFRRVGLNLDLAPVGDLGIGSAMRRRAFPGDARAVARLVATTIHGFDNSGVAPTAKHFPGLGRAVGDNTDRVSVTIPASVLALSADLLPFRAAIRARTPLVMVSHARYPSLDSQRIASQSSRIIRGLLRRQLGFRGVVVTDSLEARAVLATGSVEAAALRSLRAGCDLLLTTGPGSYHRVYERVLAAARGSQTVRRQVRVAAARVLALKQRLGLRDP